MVMKAFLIRQRGEARPSLQVSCDMLLNVVMIEDCFFNAGDAPHICRCWPPLDI